MISIENLRFQYPRSEFRLTINDLHIETGAKIAIVGPSGSGKTTLLNLIAGISVPDSGRVVIDGEAVSGMADSARRNHRICKIGLVFQQFELVEYLTTSDNIRLPFLINNSLLKHSRKIDIGRLADSVGLADKLKRFPSQLSQGEQQRVAICRALIADPKIILADEPTGNLDSKNKVRILDLLFEQCTRYDRTLVVVTHDVNILGGFDRIVDFEQFREEGNERDGMV